MNYDCVLSIWNFIQKQQAQISGGEKGGQGEKIYKL